MAAPTLRTVRAELRPLSDGNLDAVHAMWTDAGVRRYLWDGVTIAATPRRRGGRRQRAPTSATRLRAVGRLLRRAGTNSSASAAAARRRRSRARAALRLAAGGGGAGAWPPRRGCASSTISSRCPVHAEVVAVDRRAEHGVGAGDGALGMTFERRGTTNGLDTVFYRLSRRTPGACPGQRSSAWAAQPACPCATKRCSLVRSRRSWRLSAAAVALGCGDRTRPITRILLAALRPCPCRRGWCWWRSVRPGSRAASSSSPRRPTTSPTSATPTWRRWPWRRQPRGRALARALIDAAEAWASVARRPTSSPSTCSTPTGGPARSTTRLGYLPETVTIASRWRSAASRARGPGARRSR